MIKFKTEHYQEYHFPSVHDRQPTPFVQNIVTTSVRGESPSSPEYSPVRESFTQLMQKYSSSDDSDSESKSESDTTKKQSWSTDDSSDSSSDEDE